MEITKKFDEIVAFAEVEKFPDTPVKHDGTGMSVWLAFAAIRKERTDVSLMTKTNCVILQA